MSQNNSGDDKKLIPKPDDGVRKADLFRPEPCKFAFLPLGTTITIKEFDIIKLSAQFSAVYESYFILDLKKSVVNKPQFEPHFQFLKTTDKRNCFFARLALGYGRVLLRSRKLTKEGASRSSVLDGFFILVSQILEKEDYKVVEKMAMADIPAFEFFVKMEYYDFPPPSGNERYPQLPQEPFSFPLLPQGILKARNELDVIKLTAQFVAVFGLDLQQDLIESVLMNPEFVHLFQFTKTTDDRYAFYSQLVLGYTRVLLRSQKPRKKNAIVEGFSSLVCQAIKRAEGEDVVEMAMLDLHAFEFFVEMEYSDWPVPSRGYLVMVKPPQMQGSQFAHMQGSQFAHSQVPRLTSSMGMPLPEEPQPKRVKFDKPETVPDDQILAQHPDS